MYAQSHGTNVSAYMGKTYWYTSDGQLIYDNVGGNNNWGVTKALRGNDFSGNIVNGGASTIKILKSGLYQIINGGTESEQQFNVNDTITTSTTSQFFIKKID